MLYFNDQFLTDMNQLQYFIINWKLY